MYKKNLKLVISAAAVVLAAGICVGAAVRLSAKEDYDYRKAVIAKDTFEFHGEELHYAEPDSIEARLCAKYSLPQNITYKDGNGLYYSFNPDTLKLCSIDNKALDDKEYASLYAEYMKPYPDSDGLLSDAKGRMKEWFDGEIEEFEWKCSYGLGYTDWDMYQVVNGEFWVNLGCVSYDMDGDFRSMVFNFDAMLSAKERRSIISEEEAIERAGNYLKDKYGETEWEEISTCCGTGNGGSHWTIKFVKPNDYYREGYFIDVDILTGEIVREGMIK